MLSLVNDIVGMLRVTYSGRPRGRWQQMILSIQLTGRVPRVDDHRNRDSKPLNRHQ